MFSDGSAEHAESAATRPGFLRQLISGATRAEDPRSPDTAAHREFAVYDDDTTAVLPDNEASGSPLRSPFQIHPPPSELAAHIAYLDRIANSSTYGPVALEALRLDAWRGEISLDTAQFCATFKQSVADLSDRIAGQHASLEIKTDDLRYIVEERLAALDVECALGTTLPALDTLIDDFWVNTRVAPDSGSSVTHSPSANEQKNTTVAKNDDTLRARALALCVRKNCDDAVLLEALTKKEESRSVADSVPNFMPCSRAGCSTWHGNDFEAYVRHELFCSQACMEVHNEHRARETAAFHRVGVNADLALLYPVDISEVEMEITRTNITEAYEPARMAHDKMDYHSLFQTADTDNAPDKMDIVWLGEEFIWCDATS